MKKEELINIVFKDEANAVETVREALAKNPALVRTINDADGNSLLNIATQRGNVDMAKLLIEQDEKYRKENPGKELKPLAQLTNKAKQTALHFAGTNDNIEKGAPSEAEGKLLIQNRDKIAGMLIEGGADVNVIDEYGNTPLHIGALNNRKDFSTQLFKNGANSNIPNNQGHVAESLATDKTLKDMLSVDAKQDLEVVRSVSPQAKSESGGDSTGKKSGFFDNFSTPGALIGGGIGLLLGLTTGGMGIGLLIAGLLAFLGGMIPGMAGKNGQQGQDGPNNTTKPQGKALAVSPELGLALDVEGPEAGKEGKKDKQFDFTRIDVNDDGIATDSEIGNFLRDLNDRNKGKLETDIEEFKREFDEVSERISVSNEEDKKGLKIKDKDTPLNVKLMYDEVEHDASKPASPTPGKGPEQVANVDVKR